MPKLTLTTPAALTIAEASKKGEHAGLIALRDSLAAVLDDPDVQPYARVGLSRELRMVLERLEEFDKLVRRGPSALEEAIAMRQARRARVFGDAAGE